MTWAEIRHADPGWHESHKPRPTPCKYGTQSIVKPLYKSHQIPKLKCFLSPLAVGFAQSIEARCYVENEDVVAAAPTGDAPTASELSTNLLPTRVRQLHCLLRCPEFCTYASVNRFTLVQIMACLLFGDNPLSEPMMVYCQLDPEEHISMKLYLKFKSFYLQKCIWKCRLQKNVGHFVSAPMC